MIRLLGACSHIDEDIYPVASLGHMNTFRPDKDKGQSVGQRPVANH
jgi:hypothetical protein